MKEKKGHSDFLVKENNGVVAVYVVAPDLVETEPDDMKGVPFIFYREKLVGCATVREGPMAMITRVMQKIAICYGTEDELICLLANGSQGSAPEEMWEYIPTAWNGTPLVPYSFGIHHDEDEKLERPVRSKQNFKNFLKVLARVRANREREAHPIRFFLKHLFASTV